MKFDDFLYQYLGEIRRYQKIQFLLVCLPVAVVAMHSLSWTFTAVDVPSRCALPSEPANSSYYFAKSSQCHLANSTDTCDRHVFDHSKIAYSAVERWELSCNKEIKGAVQAAYYVGQMIGSILFGILGDEIGRKKVFCIAIIVQITCGLSLPFATYWWLFAILRAGTGFAHPGIFIIAVVIGTELVPPKNRRIASAITGVFFSLGQIILAIEASFVTDYRWLQLLIAIPDVLFLSYWWFIPESARWLVSKKRYDEADRILQRAANINNVTLPNKWWEQIDTFDTNETINKDDTFKSPSISLEQDSIAAVNHNSVKHSFLHMFRTPETRKRIFVLLFLWPVCSMVYYGMAMKANILGGDIYIQSIIGAAIEIPSIIIVYFLIDRIGRKTLLALTYFFAGLALITNSILTGYKLDNILFVSIIQMLITRGSITMTYTANYTYSPELFPTPLRNTAMGVLSTMARVGAIVASFIVIWIADQYGKLFMIIPFGVLAILAAILTLIFLPETQGEHLPDTIEEIENNRLNEIALKRKNKISDESSKSKRHFEMQSPSSI